MYIFISTYLRVYIYIYLMLYHISYVCTICEGRQLHLSPAVVLQVQDYDHDHPPENRGRPTVPPKCRQRLGTSKGESPPPKKKCLDGSSVGIMVRPPRLNMEPEDDDFKVGNLLFEGSIFRCQVSCRRCNCGVLCFVYVF